MFVFNIIFICIRNQRYMKTTCLTTNTNKDNIYRKHYKYMYLYAYMYNCSYQQKTVYAHVLFVSIHRRHYMYMYALVYTCCFLQKTLQVHVRFGVHLLLFIEGIIQVHLQLFIKPTTCTCTLACIFNFIYRRHYM